MAGRTGLEPATSCVTGRRSNQLNYRPRVRDKGLILRGWGLERNSKLTTNCQSPITVVMVGGTGIEPATHAL